MKQYVNKEDTALVFNIQKCSIHDGPGIRTIVFLKGCPLKCAWCANPESQSYQKEIADTYTHCIGCRACIDVCPQQCITVNEEGHGVIDRQRCNNCGACTTICYAHSKRMVGEEKTAEEIIKEVIRDKKYYDNSGGGVTFSGGEPLTRPAFLLKLAKGCKMQGIHTALETCGYADYEQFAPVLDYIDFIYMDLKEMDPVRHEKLTGKRNEVILENLKRMNDLGKSIIVRTPIIPGYNDSEENLKKIAEFTAGLNCVQGVELLAYHALGVHKYEMLGRPYKLQGVKTPSEEKMDQYVQCMNDILRPFGKKCWYEKKKIMNKK